MRRRRAGGFTLVELLVVLSLLGLLMGLSVGFIQRAGKGNLLAQSCNSVVNQLAAARAQSYGSSRAYLAFSADQDGVTTVRTFRNRQVFHWPCEDLEKASEPDMITASGVEIAGANMPGREGKYALFGAGGTVSLGAPTWLDFRDGFGLQFRLRPDGGNSASSTLIRKRNAIEVSLEGGGDGGRMRIVAKINLMPDEKNEGGGWFTMRSGDRDAAEVKEWEYPLLPGRWHDVKISYDRNTFTLHVDDRLRAVRSDRKNTMKTSEANFEIGGGYAGGFDSLLITGIFEDDEDKTVLPDVVSWLDEKDQPRVGTTTFVHFKNRSLDPRFHNKSLDFVFLLETGKDTGAKRRVNVAMSGEAFIKRMEDE